MTEPQAPPVPPVRAPVPQPQQPLIEVRRQLLRAVDVIERELHIQPRTTELRRDER